MPAPNIISFGSITLDVHTGPSGTLITASNNGTGFWGAMTFNINGVTCTDITLVDHQHITGKSPAQSGDVYIANPDGEEVTLSGVNGWINIAPASGGSQQARSQMSMAMSMGM